MRIDSYSFGRIVIDGKEYNNDVIIFPDKVKSWWRKEGHEVCLDDLKEAIGTELKMVIIGTGASGCVVIKDEVKKFLKAKGITLVAKLTKDACNFYNQLTEKKNIIAALHLTC